MRVDHQNAIGLFLSAGLATGIAAQPFADGLNDEPLQSDSFHRAPPPEANTAVTTVLPDDTGFPIVMTDYAAQRPAMYDVRTGVETIGEPVPASGLLSGARTPGQPGHFEDTAGDFGGFGENMSSLTQIDNTHESPWVVNCKLLMRYGSQYSVCSGTLIDRRTVLTAGHCINKGNGGPWADEVWVFPGYNDDNGGVTTAPYTDESDWPVGYAKATNFVSWTGWTQNGDWNVDHGYLRLDRPVGFIAGAFGFGWSQDCDTYTTNFTWHNASYPAESEYFWSGKFMYYRNGTFDLCHTPTRAQYNSAGYGGMSGSSNYIVVNSSRYAYGVMSTSNRQTQSRHCVFWENAHDYLRDTFIEDARPAEHDLWAMWSRATDGDRQIRAGEQLTVNSIVGNWSQEAYSGPVSYSYRLSTNNFISSSDSSLTQSFFNYNFGTTGSVVAPTNTLTIPRNTPSGTYWVGMLLNHEDDNASNNAVSSQDTWEFQVIGLADPTVTDFQHSTGSYYHGQPLQVQATIENIGGNYAHPISMSVRASTNSIVSAADPEIANFEYDTLDGNSSFTTPIESIPIPASMEARDQYIGIIITSWNDHDPSVSSNYSQTNTPIQVVDCLADVNNDAQISATDFTAWINAYNNGLFECDQNGDGACTATDFTAWINNYNNRCPGL